MRGPWIDLHAHPGQFFLTGLAADDPALTMRGLGGQTTEISDIADAQMTAVSFATVADLRALQLDPAAGLSARPDVDEDLLYQDHLRQLGTASDAARRYGLDILRHGDDLDQALSTGTPRLWFACEGADFVGDRLDRLAEAYQRGVRSVQLVHYRPNAYADCQTTPPQHRGLAPIGVELVREMNRLGMVVDLAHASLESTRAAIRASTDPIMVSHTHLNGTAHDHPRMISAEHAQAVADAGGVIGVWPSGFSSRSFDDFVREIDRLASLVGVDHVGIGTDMDGNYRPVMTAYRQFGDLAGALTGRGWSTDEVAAILGGNAARLIRAVVR